MCIRDSFLWEKKLQWYNFFVLVISNQKLLYNFMFKYHMCVYVSNINVEIRGWGCLPITYTIHLPIMLHLYVNTPSNKHFYRQILSVHLEIHSFLYNAPVSSNILMTLYKISATWSRKQLLSAHTSTYLLTAVRS